MQCGAERSDQSSQPREIPRERDSGSTKRRKEIRFQRSNERNKRRGAEGREAQSGAVRCGAAGQPTDRSSREEKYDFGEER